MMRIDIATLFPDVCQAYMNESILGRAARKGLIETHSATRSGTIP